MADDPLQSLRLAFKRAFTAYYLEVRSPGIADPTRAFTTCHAYLSALLDRLGPGEFMQRLDDETTGLAGSVAQDLRRPKRGAPGVVGFAESDFDELEERLRECFEYARGRLEDEGRLELIGP
jgi:hypothetical protein